MKKVLLSIVIIGTTLSLQAQWNDNGGSLTTSDNIGIGISNPTTLLNINVGNGGVNGVAGLRIGGLGNYASLEFGIDGNYDGMIRSFGNNLKYYAGHWKVKGVSATENHSHSWYTSKVGSPDWSTVKMTLNQNGNLGIGTSNPDNCRLAIHGTSNSYSLLKFSNDGNINKGLQIGNIGYNSNNTEVWNWEDGYFRVGTNNSERLRVNANGNVGIGTTNPTAPLHIKKNQSGWLQEIAGTAPNQGDFVGLKVLSGYAGDTSKWIGLSAISESLHSNQTGLGLFTGTNERLRITHNGNVGIGTIDPGSWRLAVNGNIRAKEIKVETGWSDFVFYEDYKLPTLLEVESHIKEKGHLKDIPSAKEVEENGIFLGEMDSKLLQKIEELTLYTIQQQKDIRKQSIKIKKQEKQILELKSLVEKLLEPKK